MVKHIIVLFTGLLIHSGISAQAKISGVLFDEISGESLYGATIYDRISGRGAVSNAFGYFVLSTSLDTADLVFSFVGYQSVQMKAPTSELKTLQIALVPAIHLQEVEILGSARVPLKPEGIQMNQKFIQRLPSFFGEKDVLKSAQFLPGVQVASEGTAGLVVRGGAPDQNLILWDGIPVYNAYHAFGLFSVFNPEVVQNTYLLKGSFPARYGGRLSSVLDIQTREGRKDKKGGSVGIGPLVSHLFLEGPLDSLGKTTYAISGRRTFLDVLMQPLFLLESGGKSTAGVHFHDFNFKVNHRISEKDRVYFSTYFGQDRVSFRDKSNNQIAKGDFGWGNEMATLRWSRLNDNGVFMNIRGYYSKYTFFTGFELEEEEFQQSERYQSSIRDWGVNASWESAMGKSVFRWGGNVIAHRFEPGRIERRLSFGDTPLEEDILGEMQDNLEFSAFGEWEVAWDEHWKTNVGINANGIAFQDANFFFPDPRIKASYLNNSGGVFSVGGSFLTQYIHLLTNPEISLPTDLWVSSSGKLPPGRAREINAAYAFPWKKIEWEVGVYHKQLNNLIEIKEGRNFFAAGENWEEDVAVGIGEAYGLELSAQKTWGVYQFGAAFMFSRSMRKMPEISGNRWFPYKYDRPFYLTHFGSYEIDDRNTFSYTFSMHSGNRATLPKGMVVAQDPKGKTIDFIAYGDRNSFSFPIYHRLDISYSNRKVKKKGVRTWEFSILNVYNQNNPAYIDPFTSLVEGSTNKLRAYSVLPILPSFKWSKTF